MRDGLPPGPPLPSTLQAVLWARRPLPLLERCQRRYGDVFTLRVRHSGTWVILAGPEDVKRVFTAGHASLGVGTANSILGPLLGPRSVMLLEEPEHLRRRRLMLPPFHGERMSGYGDMLARITREEVAGWPRDTPFALWPRMQEITLGAIMRLVFGSTEGEPMRRMRTLLRNLTNWMNDPRRLRLLVAAGPRRFARRDEYLEVMTPVEQAVLEEVRARRAQGIAPDARDILSLLCAAQYEDGEPMTEQDLRDEIVTLLTDGPSSALLTWIFERLLRHPEKLARLREEVGAQGVESDYLEAVVKETLRLCPAAPIVVRRLLAPMTLGGHTLPAGTTVAPCVHLIHRREEIYPRPLRFEPERFLEDPPGGYSWIPYGGGVRRCLAASYAQLLMKQVTCTVIEEVDLKAVDAGPERPRKSAIAFVPHRHGLVRIDSRPRAAGSGDGTEPAVEVDGGARHVGGQRREQEGGEVGVLLGAPHAPQRDRGLGDHALVVGLGGDAGGGRIAAKLAAFDDADQHGVDPHAVRPELSGERLGQGQAGGAGDRGGRGEGLRGLA